MPRPAHFDLPVVRHTGHTRYHPAARACVYAACGKVVRLFRSDWAAGTCVLPLDGRLNGLTPVVGGHQV